MTRALNDLDYRAKNVMMEMIARASEAGIPLMIINVLRTVEEQADNIAKGVSWTPNSLHLPQKPDGKSLAIDVCPYQQFELHGSNKLMWNADDPVWEQLAVIGERLGLRSGYRWKQKDCGHMEYASMSERRSLAL